MSLKRNALLIVGCVGLLSGCQPVETQKPADLVEEIAEVLPDQPADPQIVAAAPIVARTVFANKWVGVARVDLPPGEVIPPHEAGIRYVNPLTPGTLSVVDNGAKELIHAVPGELVSFKAGRLSLANVGESTVEILVVERNFVEPSPDLETLAIPDVAIDMERHGTVLLDDDRIVAVDVSLDRLTSESLPSNLPLLVFAESDCALELEGTAVEDVERIVRAGSAFWLPAGYAGVTNVGDAASHFLVFSFRK
jgi:hypothetical protein